MPKEKQYIVRLYKKTYKLTYKQTMQAYQIMHSLVLLKRGVKHAK